MQLRKAERKKVKLKLNLSSPSGGGKTMSALKMAKGLVGSYDKIGVIDTENGSCSLYSHLGEFNVIDLHPPYRPEKYIEAIDLCINAGMECVIIDSSSHEWDCLRDENQILADAKFRGNTWAAWSKSTPRHDAFINKVLQSQIHIITCTRSKTETVMDENKKVKKVGMKDNQRDGWEYELTVSLSIDRDTHMAIASKDRTGLFENEPPFVITEETGVKIMEWCNTGLSLEDIKAKETEIFEQRTIEVDAEFKACRDLKELAALFTSLTIDEKKQFLDLKDKLKLELTPKQ